MYLTTQTVGILKNFSAINQSILIKKGNKLRTLSPMKTVMAEAEITEEFPCDVAIYDLNQFLNCLSLVSGATLEFSSTSVNMANDSNVIDFRYSEPSVIAAPPDKELTLPSEDVCVVVSADNITALVKASSVLQTPDIAFIGDGKSIVVTVHDKKNTGSNSFKIPLGATESTFQFNLKVENLKLFSDDYDVVFSEKGLSKFTAHSHLITYFIALEPDSYFNS
jgi:hypothetical protein